MATSLRSFVLAGVVLTSLGAVARAETTVESWRAAADHVRALAESDPSQANEQAQQLEATLPASATEADRAHALNVLARTEIYLGLTAQAAGHATNALEISRSSNDAIGRAEADLNLSLTSVNLGDIARLKTVAAESVTALEGVNRPDLMVEALLRASMMYRRFGQIDEAVMLTMRGMEIARRSRSPLALTYAHQALGTAFAQAERHGEAREHWQEMLRQARAAHSRLLEGDALTGLASSLDALRDPARAESLYRQALSIFREVRAPLSLNNAKAAFAFFLRAHGRAGEAGPLYDQVITTYDRYPTPIALWYALIARSRNYQDLGNVAAAQADADRADAVAHRINVSQYLSDSIRRLAELANLKGQYRRAYELSVLAADMTANGSREKASARMVELAHRYEAENRQREIDELTRRNQQQAAELRQHSLQQRWMGTVLVSIVMVFAGTALFLVRLRYSHALLGSVHSELQQSLAGRIRAENEVRALNASLEERVQARTAELRQQTRYLRTLIDTLPLWIWLKDTSSRYLAANRANAEACGRSVEEMVGKTDIDLWPPRVAEMNHAEDLEVMTTRCRKSVEVATDTGSGVHWMEKYKVPVVDEDGTLLGTVGAAYDITLRKAGEEAREAALAEAERLARLRSDFMAHMSHELRTPLNGILGYAALLRHDNTLSERQLAGLDVIQQSGEHLLTLINDVLDFARIEAGKIELNIEDIALDTFLHTIAGIIRVKAELKRLAFCLELAPDLPAGIRADEKRLRQVLLNLLANAVRFTERGQVTLRVSRLTFGKLRFEVQDTGIGISDSQLESIFQPFEQGADTRYRSGGTGLGLAISRQYVRLMSGDIQVESRVGEGSTFRFDVEVAVTAIDAPADQPRGVITLAAPADREEFMVAPPEPELQRLHLLALRGNMRDIVLWAGRVIELEDQRYCPFATHVRRLAEAYQSQAILSFVERLLPQRGECDERVRGGAVGC